MQPRSRRERYVFISVDVKVRIEIIVPPIGIAIDGMESACHLVGRNRHCGELVVVSDEIVISVAYEFVEGEVVQLDG